MLDDKKIRENLERKIRIQEQKLNQTDKSSYISSAVDMTNDLLKKFTDLDLSLQDHNPSFLIENNSSLSSHHSANKIASKQSSNKFELEQKWKQIEQEQQKIAQIQKDIDFYRRQMLRLANDDHDLKSAKQEEKLRTEKTIQDMNLEHKSNLDKMKREEEEKIEECLKKIEVLIQEKSEFNRECEKYRMEEKKMEKLIKEQMERYKGEMKNAKEAFQALEKERRGKWQKQRIGQLKEQAITETQPRILQIIKQSNLEIKSCESKQAQRREEYEREVKQKYERELQELKERLFVEQEEGKEKLRMQEGGKANVRYQEMERQFSGDRERMREEYNRQVGELEGRVRKEIEEFISKNRQSHEGNLEEIKKLREGYETKIKKMKQSIKQRLEQGIVDTQRKHLQRYEKSLLQLQEQNSRKYLKAKQKIKQQINKRIEKIKLQVEGMKCEYRLQVDRDYQGKVGEEMQRQQQERERLARAVEGVEEKFIVEDKKLANQNQRLKQLSAEMQKIQNSNYLSQKKCTDLQTELQSLSQSEQFQQQQIKQKCKQLQTQMKQQYQTARSRILNLQEEKQKKQKELVELYVVEQKRLDDQMKGYKEDIQANLDKRMKEIARLKQELKDIQIKNTQKTHLLEQQRKKMQ